MCACACGYARHRRAGPGLGAVWVQSWDVGGWDMGPALPGPRVRLCGCSWAAAGLGSHGDGAGQVITFPFSLGLWTNTAEPVVRGWKNWESIWAALGLGPRSVPPELRTPGPSQRQSRTAPNTGLGWGAGAEGRRQVGCKDPASLSLHLRPSLAHPSPSRPSRICTPRQVAAALAHSRYPMNGRHVMDD